ncbi:lytic transglycosylase domain-containing protein [Methylobacterium ajmalii]|uniref:lytic transglycosylase domain-containing protein n=1 Tax=Methylobacterium ajmalii TaxID=2738439 RepID=UPI002F35A270
MQVRTVLLAALLALPSVAQASDVHRQVTQSARAHGVPPALAHGVVRAESGYRCTARNRHSSAKGLMQVLDKTAHGVGVRGNRLHCATGLEAGMRYLRQAYRIAHGNWCQAATLFNRGTGAARTCSGYGRRVLALARL